MYVELTTDTLAEEISSHDLVMVQYGASWCGNCRIMKPKFKKLASDNDAIPFIYVDAEKLPKSRQLANVDNLPTFAAFRNGSLFKQVQTNQQQNLNQLFDEATSN